MFNKSRSLTHIWGRSFNKYEQNAAEHAASWFEKVDEYHPFFFFPFQNYMCSQLTVAYV